MRRIKYSSFGILLCIFGWATFPAVATAELTDFIIVPSVSNVSSEVSISGTLSARFSILNDSAIYSDFQEINSSTSGTIKSAINTGLIFWQSSIQTSPGVTLSDSYTMFGFPLTLSTTINALSFAHAGPSVPFTMAPTATTGLYDIGPQDLEPSLTIDFTTRVSILGIGSDHNFIEQAPVNLTITGQVQLDDTDRPLSYYMIHDGTFSYPINVTGTGFGAAAGLTCSFNGEITIAYIAFDLNGSGALAGDFDGDDVPNEVDNCPCTYNPLQLDADGDGIGDACLFHFITSDLDKDCDVDAVDLTKMAEEFGSINLTKGP